MPKQQQVNGVGNGIEVSKDPCGCKRQFNIDVGDPPDGSRFFDGCHSSYPGDPRGCDCKPNRPLVPATDPSRCIWDPIGINAPLPLPNDIFPPNYPNVGNPNASKCAGVRKNTPVKYMDDTGKIIEYMPPENIWPQDPYPDRDRKTTDAMGLEPFCQAWRGCIIRAYKNMKKCQANCKSTTLPGGIKVPL